MLKRMLPFVLLALLATPAAAQDRPDCGETPGSCFRESGDFGGSITLNDFDPEGDAALVIFPMDADDFIRFGPDGSVHGHVQDLEADMVIFPLFLPPFHFLIGGGRGQINTALVQSGDDYIVTCPSAITYDGTAQDIDGNWYDVSRIYLSRRNPAGGCTTVQDSLSITPQ